MLIIGKDGKYYMGGRLLSDEFHAEVGKIDQRTDEGLEQLYQLTLKEGRKMDPNFRFKTGLELLSGEQMHLFDSK